MSTHKWPAVLISLMADARLDEEIERLTGADISAWKLNHLQHMLDVARSLSLARYRMPQLPIDKNGAGC